MGPYVTIILGIFFLGLCVHIGIIDNWVVCYFFIGLALGNIVQKIKGNILIGTTIAVVVLLVAKDQIFQLSIIQVVWCIAILTAIAGITEIRSLHPIFGFLSWYGKNSLSILVFHVFGLIPLKVLAPLTLKIDPTGILYAVIATGLASTACLAAAFVLDKMKLSQSVAGVPQLYAPLRDSLASAREYATRAQSD